MSGRQRERPQDRQRLGVGLLGIVIIVVLAYSFWPSDPPGPDPTPDPTQNPGQTQIPAPTQDPALTAVPAQTSAPGLTVVRGHGGELKVNFFNDPEIAKILADRYNLKVEIYSRGSIQLACGMSFQPDDDFVWLGDSVALARYQALGTQHPERSCTTRSSDSIYNSPLVFYSWTPIVDALVTAGVVTNASGVYTADSAQLIQLWKAGTTWESLGVPGLRGPIIVRTTDPAESNSGFLFAGLLATTLNGGNIPNPATIGPLLPDIQAYFLDQGFMYRKSGDLFGQYLTQGMGGMPLVALYESQISEYLAANPAAIGQFTQDVRILYPNPTVWADHPFVARTPAGVELLRALAQDNDIQRLAWERHGQRPGKPGVVVNPNAVPVPGIVPDVRTLNVVAMPALGVMDRILEAITLALSGATSVPAPSLPTATRPATPPG